MTGEEILEMVSDSLEDISDAVDRLTDRISVLQNDVDVLFESQDMNVWVIVRGIQQGDIAPGEDPMHILRTMGELQDEYRFIMGLDAFIAEMSDRRRT